MWPYDQMISPGSAPGIGGGQFGPQNSWGMGGGSPYQPSPAGGFPIQDLGQIPQIGQPQKSPGNQNSAALAQTLSALMAQPTTYQSMYGSLPGKSGGNSSSGGMGGIGGLLGPLMGGMGGGGGGGLGGIFGGGSGGSWLSSLFGGGAGTATGGGMIGADGLGIAGTGGMTGGLIGAGAGGAAEAGIGAEIGDLGWLALLAV